MTSRPWDDVRSLGAAVREQRRARGSTQAGLAERAGVSRQFVVALESGNAVRAEVGRVLAVVRALGLAVQFVDAASPAGRSVPAEGDDADRQLAQAYAAVEEMLRPPASAPAWGSPPSRDQA